MPHRPFPRRLPLWPIPLLLLAATVVPAASVAATLSASAVEADLRVVEGDILVGARMATRGVALNGLAGRWPHGEVPYVLDASLSSSTRRAIEEAVAVWNASGSITLSAISAASAPRDHVVFQTGPGCASWVGRQGGAQEIWIGEHCTSGSVMHEIGHALGLEHEHTRADRDQHIRIVWDSIVLEKRHNFATAPPDSRLLGAYDIGSIMHYGPANFSLDGEVTIVPLAPIAGVRMGQRRTPSDGDIAAVSRLYATDLALDLQVDDVSAVSEAVIHVTNQHAQGAHGIVVKLTAAGSDMTVRSEDGWQCTTTVSDIDCRLQRLDGNAHSRLSVAFASPVPGATLQARVSSTSPDVDPADNAGSGNGIPVLAQAVSGNEDPLASQDMRYLDQPLSDDQSAGGSGSWSFAGCVLLLLGWFVRQAVSRQGRRRHARS